MQKLNKILRQNLEDVIVAYLQKDSGIRLQRKQQDSQTLSHNSQQHDKHNRHLFNATLHFTTKPSC